MSEVVALSAVEAQRLGDRLKKFIETIGTVGGVVGSIPGGLAGFLDNFDIGKVGAFLEAVKAIGAAPDLKAKVLAALEAGKAFAVITTTTVDDTIINTVAGVVGNSMVLDFIVGIIEKLEAAQSAGTMSVLSDDHLKVGAPVNASALDIALWIQVARAIWSVIQLFRKPAAA